MQKASSHNLMDWGAIEADIMHVQNLMRESNFAESIEVIKKCLKALINSNLTNETLADLSTVQQCLIVHLAMGLLYCDKPSDSLGYFGKVNTRRIFTYMSELVSTESTYGLERVFEASRNTLLHSYMNASVAADKCHRPQATQAYLEKAIQLYRENQLTGHEAVSWHRLGKLLAGLERLAQAGLSLSTAALLFRRCRQSLLEAEALCDLADVSRRAGDPARASEAIARTQALCVGLAHRPEQQRQLYRRIGGLYRERRSPSGQGPPGGDRGLERARGVLRRGQLLSGDRDRRGRALREAREECELASGGSPDEASKMLIGIANRWSELGEFGECESILERVVELSRTSDLELTLSEALERLGDVLVKQRKEREAATRYNEASMVLELKYNETGEEQVGGRLQSVWNKHVSLNSQGMAEGQLPNGTGEAEDSSCRDTIAFFPDVALLGNCYSKSTEPELRSLVTVSDLSEMSGNETILASDTYGNRSLSNRKNSKESEIQQSVNSNDKQNLKHKMSTRSTRTIAFRRNRISPVESVSSRGSEGDIGLAENGQQEDLKPQSKSCIIL